MIDWVGRSNGLQYQAVPVLCEVLGGRLIRSWTDGGHRKRRMTKEMPSSSYKYHAIMRMSWILGGRLIDRHLVGRTTDI